MKIEKFRNGYRIRKTYKGKTYFVLFDHKPTQKEALERMSEKLNKITEKGGRLDFETAAFNYIESKSSVLSPSTYREYTNNIKRYSNQFRKLDIYDITLEDIQKEINELSKTRAPKTVRNYNAFISSVIGFYRKGVQFSVTLPQKVKKEPYIPSDNDIKQILSVAKGTRYEIPIRLACYGLRRSEICAITSQDLDGNYLRINKAVVQDKNKNWVVKTTKTEDSTRIICIDTELADLLRQQTYAYKGYPNSIYDWLDKTEKKLGLQHFGLHKLRHYYASMAHSLGIPDANIMAAGGWKTDTVMKSIYRHAMADKQKESLVLISDHLSKLN